MLFNRYNLVSKVGLNEPHRSPLEADSIRHRVNAQQTLNQSITVSTEPTPRCNVAYMTVQSPPIVWLRLRMGPCVIQIVFKLIHTIILHSDWVRLDDYHITNRNPNGRDTATGRCRSPTKRSALRSCDASRTVTCHGGSDSAEYCVPLLTY